MYICPECGTQHETQPQKPDTTTLVDLQCFNCGQVLTQSEVDALKARVAALEDN